MKNPVYSTPPTPKNTSSVLRPTMSESQPPSGWSSMRIVSAMRLITVPASASPPENADFTMPGPVTE